MKKALLILSLSFILVSCNNPNNSEPINNWSGNNVSVSQEWTKVISNSWDHINSVTVWEKWINIKTSGNKWKPTNISAESNWTKNTWVSIESTWGVVVNTDSWASTDEVDSLLKEIDKMIDSK